MEPFDDVLAGTSPSTYGDFVSTDPSATPIDPNPPYYLANPDIPLSDDPSTAYLQTGADFPFANAGPANGLPYPASPNNPAPTGNLMSGFTSILDTITAFGNVRPAPGSQQQQNIPKQNVQALNPNIKNPFGISMKSGIGIVLAAIATGAAFYFWKRR